MRPHLLVVGGNDSSAVKAAHLDADVTLFQLRRLLTPHQIDACRRVVIFDFEQLDETVALARAIHSVHPFDASVSFWERALLPAAVAGEALGIATNPASAVRLTRDKLAMREALADAGDGVPFRRCDTPDDVAQLLAEVGGPVVLKPTLGSGSAGVVLVSSERDIERAWLWATAAGVLPLFAEAYVDGLEYSVESLTLDGRHRILGITDKLTTGPPHFIETGHRFPANLDADVEQQIHARVSSLLTRVGHVIGPSHTEVRLTNRGPVVIETQTRFGGDQIWEMVEIVTGVDLTLNTCAHLLGLPAAPPTPRGGGIAIRFFAYEQCAIDSVSGIEEARAQPGVLRVECTLQAGSTLGPLVESKSRQGYVLARASSSEEAWNVAGNAIARVNVTLTSSEPGVHVT